MEALVGTGDGWNSRGDGTKGTDQEFEEQHLDHLIARLREDWRVVMAHEQAAFKARSETLMQKILKQAETERRATPWRTRARSVLRWARSLKALAAALWNSRAVRLIVP